VVAAGPGPIEDVSAQGPPYSLALVIRVDHEAGGGHVRAAAGPVRGHLRRTQDRVTIESHHGTTRRLLHPPGSGVLKGQARWERVGTPGGDDEGEEGVDAWPVLPYGRPDDHVPDSRRARRTGVIYLHRPATRW